MENNEFKKVKINIRISYSLKVRLGMLNHDGFEEWRVKFEAF